MSVVIPTNNRREKVLRLVEQVLASDYPSERLQVIVVDDASTDGTTEAIMEAFPAERVQAIRCAEKAWVSKARNIGIDQSSGDYLYFVDDDVVMDPACIRVLVDFMESREDVGLVGPLICFADATETVWSAGIREELWTTMGTFLGQNHPITEFVDPVWADALPTACMARRAVVDQHRYDEELFPIQFEEIDFAIRVGRAGWGVCSVPLARAWHDRPRATFLRNNSRAYYLIRNRYIRVKLWSVNPLQLVTGTVFATGLAILYWASGLRYASSFLGISGAAFRGLVDGVRLLITLKRPDAYAFTSLAKRSTSEPNGE